MRLNWTELSAKKESPHIYAKNDLCLRNVEFTRRCTVVWHTSFFFKYNKKKNRVCKKRSLHKYVKTEVEFARRCTVEWHPCHHVRREKKHLYLQKETYTNMSKQTSILYSQKRPRYIYKYAKRSMSTKRYPYNKNVDTDLYTIHESLGVV